MVVFLILTGSAMVVIFPGLIWELHGTNKAFRGFSDALIAKQYEQAYDFTSKEFRESTDFQTFVKVHDGLTVRMGDLKSVEASHIDVKDRGDGWYGTVEASMVFDRGSLPFIFVLKKAGRSWEIYNYHEQ